MPLDPSIALNVTGYQDALGKVLANKAAQQQMSMQQQEMQLKKQMQPLQMQAARDESQLKRLELAGKQTDRLLQIVGMAKDEPSYQQALQFARQQGIPVDNAPPVYDPGWVDHVAMSTLGAKEKIQLQIAQAKAQADSAYKMGNLDINREKAGAYIKNQEARAKFNLTQTPQKPASIQEYEYFKGLSPEDQDTYIRTKRTGGAEEFDKTMGRESAKSYVSMETRLGELDDFDDNLDEAESLLAKVKLTGPVMGRGANAANDPDYKNYQGQVKALTLMAKGLLNMPSANFSDADRDFLTAIVDEKYNWKEGSEKGLKRLKKMSMIARKNITRRQKKIDEKYPGQGQQQQQAPAQQMQSGDVDFSEALKGFSE